MKIKNLAILLIALLTLLCFVGCVDTAPDGGKDGKILYNIKVVDALGNPIPNMVVDIMLDGELSARKITNNEGVVKASEANALDAATYNVTLTDLNNKPFYYDASVCVLEDASEELTITVYDIPNEDFKETLYFSAASSDSSGEAYIVSEGGYRVELSAGANYFVFTPSRRGLYEIDASVGSLGYLGSPHFVQSGNIASEDDSEEIYLKQGKLCLKIRGFNVGSGYGSTSRYVVVVTAEKACEAFIKINCDPNLAMSLEELPWEEYLLTGNHDVYTLPALDVDNAELKNVDIFDENLTIVYNSTDKFYHIGEENGPIVLVKLKIANDYLPSFSEMMETSPFSAYIYDENGEFVAKRDYNSMLASYCGLADPESGVYPLNKDLEQILLDIGGVRGWYDTDGANNIFLDDASRVVEKNAYLFACCYYDGGYATGSDTAPLSIDESGTLAVSSTYVYLSSMTGNATITISDPDGIYTACCDGLWYSANDGVITFTAEAGEVIILYSNNTEYSVLTYTASITA